MNNLIKTMLCSAAALVLAGTSVAQTRRAFTELDFSTIQSPNSNPFGLTHRDAITANEQGKVNIHRITYELDGLKIAANIYTPAGYDASKNYPALVVAHPNGGCKEQVAGLYSQRMAAQGYICLAFDAAYQGGSEGEPRNVDKPANRVEDIHRACDILAQYPGVDASRVGVLGICGGGGYTLKATGRALRTCVKPILICSPSFPVILSAGLPFPPAVSQTQDGFLQKTGRKPTACKGKFVSLQAVCRHTPQASGAQTPHIKHI